MFRYLVFLAIAAASIVAARAADQNTRTVIYDGVATEVAVAPNSSTDLWITTGDLTRATRFVIKPQGVCRDELCFPLPKNRKAEFVSKKGTTTWFNLSEVRETDQTTCRHRSEERRLVFWRASLRTDRLSHFTQGA